MKKILFSQCLLLICISIFANADHRLVYIDQYKDVAISEMHRTGIPASIKLAQAILESNAGQSTLAQKANNHFGIKCGSSWNGRTYFRKDDDRNLRGKLVKSCFRSFPNPMESFIEHSDFLYRQNRKRYGFLFNYDTSDYTNWAYGLKKAGYATDSHYAGRLIQIIEEFQLYQFDRPGGMPDFANTEFQSAPDKSQFDKSEDEIEVLDEISINDFKTKIDIFKHNTVNVTYTLEGDNLEAISERTGITLSKLIKFNDGINGGESRFDAGIRIYLANKKTKNRGKKKFHYVTSDDTMIALSQAYGIRLKSLYVMNNMPHGLEPAIGEKIRLKGKASKGKSIKTRMLRFEEQVNGPDETPIVSLSKEEALQNQDYFTIDPIIVDPKPEEESVVVESSNQESSEVEQVMVNDPSPLISEQYYIVSKGDTLWNISQRMGTTVDKLKLLNGLSSNAIFVGNKLRIQ